MGFSRIREVSSLFSLCASGSTLEPCSGITLNVNIKLLTGKTDYKDRKKILFDFNNNKINFLIGTHSLFQEKIKYSNLGLIIIDEQHKFGVKQRKKLSDKGGNNCDVLVMSATPIPRTMIMTVFGDMDISLIRSKPKNRKEIKTYSKLDSKIEEIRERTKNFTPLTREERRSTLNEENFRLKDIWDK